MLLPDNLEYGIPVFHANALWMLLVGSSIASEPYTFYPFY